MPDNTKVLSPAIRPMIIYVKVLITKDPDGYLAEIMGHPETCFSSDNKEEAIDGALELGRRIMSQA